ncbi:MAG: DUF1289 domain-containing protein [Burkholderiaceae bacterium]
MTPITTLDPAQAVRAQTQLPVPSPCLSVCRMDAGSSLCAGCFRTLDEIAAWGAMNDAGKRAVWALIAQRAAG